MQKTYFFFLLLFFSGFSASLPAQNPLWMEGSWIGEGNQPNALTHNTWPIEFTCTASNGIYTIQYPSFPCGGTWELQSYDNSQATFIERLSYGMDKCLDGGKVVVYLLDNNYLRFIYYERPNTSLVLAKAVVKLVINN